MSRSKDKINTAGIPGETLSPPETGTHVSDAAKTTATTEKPRPIVTSNGAPETGGH